jgi:hypothetical protein
MMQVLLLLSLALLRHKTNPMQVKTFVFQIYLTNGWKKMEILGSRQVTPDTKKSKKRKSFHEAKLKKL